MAYIIATDGTPYLVSEFVGGNYTGYDQTPYSRSARCLIKGGYIPIYQIWESFYTSDFDNGNGYGGYYMSYSSGKYWYTAGKVISVTEPKDGRIGALVVYKYDDTPRTLAQRQAEIAGGEYTYNSPIYVCFVYTSYDERFDYTKFLYAGGNYYCWMPTAGGTLFENGYSRIQLVPAVGWGDGAGSMLGATLCIPFMYSLNNGDYNACGLIGSFLKKGEIDFMGSYDDIKVSEDEDDYIAIGRGLCCEYSYLSPTANFTFDFRTDFNSGFEPPQPPPEYPFEEDYNGGGGGTGDYTDTSDEIPLDGVPVNSAIASGFINAYLLTQQNAVDFHSYLYSGSFAQNVAKLMNDPIDYIIGFMLAPYTPDTSSATHIYIGGTDSEVSATRISSGYKTVDCGSVQLNEFWGKFYDYNPYTKLQVYLPFIGVRPLDIDEAMAGNVNLTYRIDVLTGDCVATVSVDNARGTKGAIYNFNGNCHSHIPVCGKNSLATGLNVAGSFVGMATGIATGNVAQAVTGAINTVKSGKAEVEHGGNLSGSCGLLANFTPFLIVSRPSQSLAQNYNHYHGFISNVTAQLGTLSGYTQVAELVQTDIHCTLDEFEEINTLLKEGVYL